MMSMIYYSFVIPHHNTPDLLQRLIDSIPQRDDIEIIVVDDNSDEDKKASITRPDVKTIFIDKEHTKGAGHARNIGIEAATGKWLLFADADDFYCPNFISILDDYKDDDIEMLLYSIDSVNGETLSQDRYFRVSSHRKFVLNYDGSKETSNNLLFLAFGPWRKMLLTDYVKSYGFQFEEIPKDNDHLFSLLTSYFCKKWKVDKRSVYTLTYTEGSITYSKLTKTKCLAHFNVLRRRAKLYSYMGHPEWNWKCGRGRFFQSCLWYSYKRFKKNRAEGLRCFYYYFTNIISIEKGSNYYIDLIESIKKKIEK